MDKEQLTPEAEPVAERRHALGWLSRVGAVVGVGAAYGVLATMMGRFLFPSGPPSTGWMYVARLAQIGRDQSLLFRTPSGATVNVARQGEGEQASDFIALSSTCPHLGCQVHWQPQNERFFCPCHNGVFSPDGTGIGGPPGEAGQSLSSYPLKAENGLLFIEVSLDELAAGEGEVIDGPASRDQLAGPVGPPGPGHDPCLYSSSSGPCPCGGALGGSARIDGDHDA